MAILNRDMLKEIKDDLFERQFELVEIKPGIQVRIAQLSAEAGFAIVSMGDKDTPEKRNQEGILRWIAASCVDEDGKEVFKLDELKQMPFELVQKLAQAVNRINAISSPEAVEDARKN